MSNVEMRPLTIEMRTLTTFWMSLRVQRGNLLERNYGNEYILFMRLTGCPELEIFLTS